MRFLNVIRNVIRYGIGSFSGTVVPSIVPPSEAASSYTAWRKSDVPPKFGWMMYPADCPRIYTHGADGEWYELPLPPRPGRED
jgi:hypothetical protein